MTTVKQGGNMSFYIATLPFYLVEEYFILFMSWAV